MFYLHFDSYFVSCAYEGEFRGHFGFFHSNLLVSNFYFWSAMLTEINHTIVNIFSGTFIVRVNKKTTEILYLKVKQRVFLTKDTKKNI